MEVRLERREEHRIIQPCVYPGQLTGQNQRLRRQDRIPQRPLVICSSDHNGLDPFSPMRSRPSSRQTRVEQRTSRGNNDSVAGGGSRPFPSAAAALNAFAEHSTTECPPSTED